MRMRQLTIGMIIAAGLGLLGHSARAADEVNAAALAKALAGAKISLEQGLRAGEKRGKPISGKYEIEDGALQLSVYTMKGTRFAEVIVDHKTGAIKKTEPITAGDDLKDAKSQGQAMAQAKISLRKATQQAVKANAGYRAVAVMPISKNGHSAAEVTLIKGNDLKKVTQQLD